MFKIVQSESESSLMKILRLLIDAGLLQWLFPSLVKYWMLEVHPSNFPIEALKNKPETCAVTAEFAS